MSTPETVQPSSDAASQNPASTAPVSAEPTVVELTDDMMVRLPGSDKPTKYGEWFRGYQGRYTEATQARNQLRQQLQHRDSELENLRTELARHKAALDIKPTPENPVNKLRDQLKQLPYVKGEEVGQVMEALYGEVESGRKALQVRDQAIRLLAQELTNIRSVTEQLYRRSAQGDFDAKIRGFREQLGLPEEAQDFLAELYSAYEGENLDDEFPQIAQRRYEQLKGLIAAENKRRVEEARRNRFVPGKGGMVTPGKGGPPDTSAMNAKDTADALFEQFVRPGEDS